MVRLTSERGGLTVCCTFVSAIVFVSGICVAFPNEPDGFGGARFGMSANKVAEVFPRVQQLGSAPDGILTFYTLEKHSFAGLEPCTVTLAFVGDRLYEARFDCGRDEKVQTALQERFGAPTSAESMLVWRGEKTIVSLNPKVMTFALADAALTQAAHEYILGKAMGASFKESTRQSKGALMHE